MFKHGEINPLSVFGLRRLDHCPPHFTQVKFDINTAEKAIIDWIYEHLTGRFYLDDEYQRVENIVGIQIQKLAAFETASEASYFALILSTINTDHHPF